MAALGVERSTTSSAGPSCSSPSSSRRALEGALDRPRPLLAIPGNVAADAPPPRSARRREPVGAHFDERELLVDGAAGDRPLRAGRDRARVTNIDLAVGGRLSNALVRRHGADGLPDGHDRGRAQRLGRAELRRLAGARGSRSTLAGEANDYAGKGLSGGILSIRPPAGAGYQAAENVIAGNVALYGATDGQRVLPRPRRRAVRGPQLGRRWRSSRASASTAAST